MKILKMKNGFNRMSDADLNHKAGIILQAMTDNPNFPSPSPTLAQVTDTLNAYSAAVLKAMDKGLQKNCREEAAESFACWAITQPCKLCGILRRRQRCYCHEFGVYGKPAKGCKATANQTVGAPADQWH